MAQTIDFYGAFIFGALGVWMAVAGLTATELGIGELILGSVIALGCFAWAWASHKNGDNTSMNLNQDTIEHKGGESIAPQLRASLNNDNVNDLQATQDTDLNAGGSDTKAEGSAANDETTVGPVR